MAYLLAEDCWNGSPSICVTSLDILGKLSFDCSSHLQGRFKQNESCHPLDCVFPHQFP